MADKMKHDFYVPVVRQMALDNVPLRNGHSSQNVSEEPMFILFSLAEMMKNMPMKWLFVVVADFGILYKASKLPVTYDKCIGKLMVVCNL